MPLLSRLETVWYGLMYAAEEMGVALARTAVSPNIRDRMDFSCAILDGEGRLVAQAEHIPVHLGSMAVAGLKVVEAVLSEYEPREGDVYATNDPYLAGTHLNDVMMVRPVFIDGKLVAWVANKAHHVDLGGSAPGSMGVEAKSLYEEGLVVPVVKLASRDDVHQDLLKILASNSRTPSQLRMDLHAQMASLVRGESLVKDLASRYGLKVLLDSMEWSLNYVESYARRSLAKISGKSEAEDLLELPEGHAVVRVRITVEGGEAIADFSGTSPQVDRPLNAVYGVTVAATTFALKAVVDPEMPVNHGFYRAVKVVAPEGSLVNPRPPAPVSAGNTETSQRIVDVVLKALASIAPGKVPAASCGTMTNVAVGGRGWAFYETVGCGSGARPGADGVDGVHVNMTNTMNTPVEILEAGYPVIVLKYGLREGSSGLGRFRGGMGIVRVYKFLDKVRVTVVGNRARTRPWGLEGGLPGAPARYYVIRHSGEILRLEPMGSADLEEGDVLVVETPGGGGYGDPCLRPVNALARDVEEGRVPPDDAKKLELYCTSK